jgi:hypothetical protein
VNQVWASLPSTLTLEILQALFAYVITLTVYSLIKPIHWSSRSDRVRFWISSETVLMAIRKAVDTGLGLGAPRQPPSGGTQPSSLP